MCMRSWLEARLVLSPPELEHRQGKQALGIKAALTLAGDNCGYGAAIEDLRIGLRQNVAHVAAPATPKPGIHRKRKSLLSSYVQLRRQNALCKLAENNLSLAFPVSEMFWEAAKRKVENLRIKHRRSHLQ